ncbi:sugar ABC transporter permease [Paenibacillus pectinilyticus]|uniref:Sugar ABC transporter permease n=1 Tax=Paenibacillus pectinilyticus TaxID=512399 RepID=A0A1C1A3A7_9BACL|nr:carbohydrate ABC transporter permease [Paenibacillus pectinilyticus]OCT15028.1 sugar ABC transporter permease [Paenibacillus pectinilyticus]
MGFTSHKKRELNTISNTSNFIVNVVFMFYVILCISPLVLVFMVSITDEQSIVNNGFSFFPEKFSWMAYTYIFNDSSQIIRSYGISIFITVVGTLVSLLVTALYAYPISRPDLKSRNIFAFLIFFTLLFSGGLVPYYMVYSNVLHLKDTLIVLILPLLLTPFYVLIMRTFFATNVPDAILESAKIDGAGEYRIFFSIVLNLSRPVLATIGLFNTITYWNDWFTALLFITNPKLMPLQLLLHNIQSSIQIILDLADKNQGSISVDTLPSQSARMGMVIIAIGPIILAYPFLQKYFIKGLTVGAIKG